MAIERILDQPDDLPAGMNGAAVEEEVEIEIVNPESVSIETPDGGMVFDFNDQSLGTPAFNDNLAEFMEDGALELLSSDLTGEYNADRDSRSEWIETYTKGLDLLGLNMEERTTPWAGACGVTHPLLGEAVVRFQSQAIGEIFPAGGPVRTKILGKMDEEKAKQAQRLQQYMNHLVQDVMTEYRAETEKLLFSLPLAGSAFRKIYFDPNMGRPCAMFVPAEDMVVSYGASSLDTCERVTHVMRTNENDVKKLQHSGFYRNVELGSSDEDTSRVSEKINKLTGDHPSYEADSRRTLLEMHTYLDLAGFEDTDGGTPTGIGLPYVVTIDQSSRKVLSIRRNWVEGDEKKNRRNHFVHYEYIPGLGFYGFGLIHLTGGLAKSATSLLRQLVDAGTLSNLPGGLKARGLRIKGDDTPIYPGEFRDVDVPGGSIRDNITFLPYKEPSSVLYSLLGNIVEEGRRFASLTDVSASDMNQEAPVGTTLAILERNMKVMSAIQSRLHAAMKKEFGILTEVVRDQVPGPYPIDVDDPDAKDDDFLSDVDVVPVSDPNAGTMAQRIMQYQSALQLASQAPQMYDLPKLHRQMLEVLGIRDPDDLVPTEDDIKPEGPVSENMNFMNGKPTKAFMYQDHEAHITVHNAFLQDPMMQQMLANDPNAQAIGMAASAHITEHVAFLYRRKIEEQLGVELPPVDEPLPEDIEVQLSAAVAEAANRLLQKDTAEAQMQQQMQQMEDPVLQMQRQELEIRAQEVAQKGQSDQAKIALDQQKSQMRNAVEIERIKSQKEIAGARVGGDMAQKLMEISAKDGELSSRERAEDLRTSVDATKTLMDMQREMQKLREENASKERIENAKLEAKLAERLADRARRGAEGE